MQTLDGRELIYVLGILIQSSLLMDGLFREGRPSILSCRGGGDAADSRRDERRVIWERMEGETRKRRT